MTTISIVTPTLNQDMFIGDTIKSIISQKSKSKFIDYLIFDSMSSDGTKLVVRTLIPLLELSSINVRYIREKDSGQSDAINKGWKIAKGQILTYVNSDDYYEPNILNKVITYFDSNPDVMWAYGGWNLVDINGKVLKKVSPKSYSYSELLNYCNIGQPSCFFRRELLEEFGYLDTNKHLAMDYDLWLKFAQKYDAGILPFTISNMRYYSNAKSSKFVSKQLYEMLKINTQYTSPLSIKRFEQYFYYFRGLIAAKLSLDTISKLQKN